MSFFHRMFFPEIRLMPDITETLLRRKKNQIKFRIFGLTAALSSFILISRVIFPKAMD